MSTRFLQIVLVLGLVTVGIGWWLDTVVNHLRDVRATTSDAVLTSPSPTPEQLTAANQARSDFGKWHTYSLFANFATVALVTVGMALAAQLPSSNGEAPTSSVAPREEVAAAP